MRVASQLLEVDVLDLEWADGQARVKGTPSKGVSRGRRHSRRLR